jgi:hypothetical protein
VVEGGKEDGGKMEGMTEGEGREKVEYKGNEKQSKVSQNILLWVMTVELCL